MKKTLTIVGASIGLLIGTIGLLHAPFARGFLMKVGGCPVGKASAADVEMVRKQSVASMRGNANEAAPARPALGFVLDRTTASEVTAWAKANDVSCEEKREGMLVICKDVASRLLLSSGGSNANGGSVEEVSFAFRPSDKALVNVTAMSFDVAPEEAAAQLTRTTDKLTSDLGAPTSRDGEMTEARLAKGGFTTSMASYRFRDYIAEVSATSFDGPRVVVREHYVSATD